MGGGRRWRRRLAGSCGVAGPAAFTLAWLFAGWRQEGYVARHEHISGLAAPDARRPHVMTVGFVALGGCTIVFSRELRRLLGGRKAGAGPALLALGGAAEIAAGLLRRDTMLLNPPGRPEDHQQSWRNDGHDLASGVAYLTTVLAPLTFAWRFRADPAWRPLARAAWAAAATDVLLMPVFATDVERPGSGILQRVIVSTPLCLLAAMGVRAVQLADRPSETGGPRSEAGTASFSAPF